MHIHRDDLLEGGTKRRALRLMLANMDAPSVFYAGTIMGHGALALAHACAETGKRAEIFICGTPDDPMVRKIAATNAVLHLQPPMPVAALHDLAARKADGRAVFPPGFDMPGFETALAGAIGKLPLPAHSEIWTVAVTGTLTRALQRAFPQSAFKTVKVVKQACDLGRAEIFQAPEKYHQPAKLPPPYPSCPYTDAKLWQFARLHAAPDALIWNTAG